MGFPGFISLVILLIASVATAQSKLDRAVQFVKEGQYDIAAPMLEQIAKEPPGNASACYYLGIINMASDYDRSIQYLEKAIELNYGDAEYHLTLGNAYGIKAAGGSIFGKIGAAGNCLKQFKLATQLDPKYADARAALIEYYLQAPGIIGGSVEKALAEADTIKMMDPCRGYLEEGRIYENRKDAAKQLQSYEKALSVDPKSLVAYRALLWFYSGRKDEKKAKEIFTEGLKAVSEKSELYYSVGLYFSQKGDFTRAEDMFRSAIKMDSTNAGSYYHLGLCALLSGKNLEGGLADFQKCLQIDPAKHSPTWPYVHWRMGMIHEKLGNKSAAKSEYEIAYKMNSHIEVIKKALEAMK